MKSCSPTFLEKRRRSNNRNLETDSDNRPQPESEPRAKDTFDGHITKEKTTSSLIESKSRARLNMIEAAIERRMAKMYKEKEINSQLKSFKIKDFHKNSEEERQNMRSEIEKALSENARKRISSRKKENNKCSHKQETKKPNDTSRKAKLKVDHKNQPVNRLFPSLDASSMVVNKLDSVYKGFKQAENDINDIVNLSGKCKNRKIFLRYFGHPNIFIHDAYIAYYFQNDGNG